MGDFSKIGSLSDMYTNCRTEDPDITPLDFVFEHLLNLGSIIESFEHHDKNNEKEIPHQPYHFHINSFQVVCNITQPQVIDFNKEGIAITDFAIHNEDFIPSGYSNNVFRPPIV